MARTCIICGGPTGSREHVFPAALGGRRTNRGIYCGVHNNDYSPLATILSDQFKAINALLGVRGDHATKPNTLDTTDAASGERIILTSDGAQFAEPNITRTIGPDGAWKGDGRFANKQQLQDWLVSERKAGREVQTGERSAEQQFHASYTKVELMLGGSDGLRAIGYVALTFLAHHFPEVARSAEMQDFRDYTRGYGRDDRVWWDRSGSSRPA